MEADKLSLYIVTSTILVTICLIIFFKSKTRRSTYTWLLGAYFTAYLLTVVVTYIVLTPYIEYVPHLFRLGNLFFLCMIPLSYLYFRTSTGSGSLGWSDLIHMAPALVYVVDYFPFFMLSGQEKMNILHHLSRYGVKGGFNDGWLMPRGWNNLLRFFIFGGYWLAQCVMVYKASKQHIAFQRKWLIVLLGTQALFVFPPIVLLVLGKYETFTILTNFLGLVAALIQGYMLLMNPDIINASESRSSTLKHGDKPVHSATALDGFADIHQKETDPETLVHIQASLNRLMEEEKPFLNPALKIHHLAELLGIPTYRVSSYLNEKEHKNFHEYVNEKRINYCIQKLKTGEGETKTLEALAQESGFNSRGTFIRVFKKKTGKTPSEYLHEHV